MNQKRDTEEMKMWLFDLAHGNLKDDAIVKGFIKHYVLFGLVIGNVQDNIVFRTNYGDDNCRRAMEDLRRALTEYANAPEPPESRTLEEVHRIVAAVRAGIPMQIAYSSDDPELDNEYVYRPCW